MLFWIIAGLITLVVGASLAAPLVLGRGSGADPDRARGIYRDQLAEVDRDLARGVIEPGEAERARTEIARRILATDRGGPVVAGEAPVRLSRPVAAGVLLLAVGGAFGIYGLVGSPGQGDLPRAARIERAEAMRESRPSQAVAEAEVAPFVAANRITPPPDIQAVVDSLRAALAENPDDLQGWQMLTDFETRTGNLAAAAAAMGEVVRVKGEAATLADLTGLVDRMVFSAQGYVSPEAEAVLDRIAAMAPDDPGLLYYAGLLYAQTDRADLAFDLWRRVIETGGDGLHARLARDGIADVAWLAGRNYTPPDLPGPSAGDVAAAAGMAPEDREAMIRGMVAQLSDRLATEGGPAEDWARLITSLGVLGESAQAGAIWAEAQGVFADDAEALARIRDAAVQAGVDR
jgi:cytochrome c-type biogenesis protein CcmH